MKFRVHFSVIKSGTSIVQTADIEADNPKQAETTVRKGYPGCVIRKIKALREQTA